MPTAAVIVIILVLLSSNVFSLLRERHERQRLLEIEDRQGRTIVRYRKALTGLLALYGKRERLLLDKVRRSGPTRLHDAWKSHAIALEVAVECAAERDETGLANASAELSRTRNRLTALGEYS